MVEEREISFRSHGEGYEVVMECTVSHVTFTRCSGIKYQEVLSKSILVPMRKRSKYFVSRLRINPDVTIYFYKRICVTVKREVRLLREEEFDRRTNKIYFPFIYK